MASLSNKSPNRKLSAKQVSSILSFFTASKDNELYGDRLNLPFNLKDTLIASDSATAIMIAKSHASDRLASIKFNENETIAEKYGKRIESMFYRPSYRTSFSISDSVLIKMIYNTLQDYSKIDDSIELITKISYVNTTKVDDIRNSGHLLFETNADEYFSSKENNKDNKVEITSSLINLSSHKKDFTLSAHKREEFEAYFNTNLLMRTLYTLKEESDLTFNITGSLNPMEVISDRISVILLPIRIKSY